MRRLLIATVVLCTQWLAATGQPLCHVTYYDEDSGLPHGHVTQLLQSSEGFIWLATWNGLCRYDGYDFVTFKPQAGDHCHIETDRLRDIALLPDGNISCQTDEDIFIFDTATYRFRDLRQEERPKATDALQHRRQSQSLRRNGYMEWEDRHHTRWRLGQEGTLSYLSDGTQHECPLNIPVRHPTFAMNDRQGNLWVLSDNGLYKLCTDEQRTHMLPQQQPAQVRCLFTDRHGRYWVATREDATLRAFAADDDRLLGYLGADGRLHPTYTRFHSAVYCMYESSDSTLWAGTKPGGLFRLRPEGGRFNIDHIASLPAANVYSIIEDSYHRIWVATLDSGLFVCPDPHAPMPHMERPARYPTGTTAQRARYLHITRQGVLLAATTDGLIASRLMADAHQMTFVRHHREAERAESMSSSAAMDIVEDSQGRIYVSTESGGVNMTADDPLDEHPRFRHIDATHHLLPGDVVLSLTPIDAHHRMVVGSHMVTLIDSVGPTLILDATHFNGHRRFSEAHPIRLSGGRWLFGLTDGAIISTLQKGTAADEVRRVVLTSATVKGTPGHWDISRTNRLTLQPQERTVTLHFAAIDYATDEPYNYAFRLVSGGNDDTPWNFIGHDRSVTLIDLDPGRYILQLAYTDDSGLRHSTTDDLTIDVTPTFWETGWGKLVIALAVLAIISAVLYTYLYIKRIKRQQHETLEAYLTLLNQQPDTAAPDEDNAATKAMPHVAPEDDAMIKRLMTFIEQNLDNSELRVADLAAAATTSASGLQRKLRQAMGVTPQDLLREARIKHAALLLRQTDKSVAEVAYACGFSDPKYFSRCFKTSMGQSPTDYKNAL